MLRKTEMVTYKLVYTKQAQKDAKKIAAAGLKKKVEALLVILTKNPYQSPPPVKRLVGDLSGVLSRRITLQHRLVYCVLDDLHVVKILRIWTHYEHV